MKNFNIAQLNGDRILKDLELYINNLKNRIEVLKGKLDTYNKDEEIQKLHKEISDIRTHSLIILSEKEKREAKLFGEEHYHSCKSNIIYILEGTGIGTAIDVKCKKCQTVKDITDTDNW